MVYSKSTKKRTQKRKFKSKSYRRKYKYGMTKMSKYNEPVRFFKRKCNLGYITTSVSGYGTTALTFQLSDLPAYTEFQSLFDLYSLRYVKLYIVARATGTSLIESSNTSNIGFPNLIAIRDYTDADAVAASEIGYNVLREYSTSKTFTFTAERRCFSYGIVPALRSEAYKSALTTTYSPIYKQYITTGDPSAPHYAVKIIVQVPTGNPLNTPAQVFDIYATYYLSFKTTK